MKPQFALLAFISVLTTVCAPLPLNFPAPFSTPQALAQTPSSRKAEADRLFEQGRQQGRTSQFEAALQSLQQSLAIYKEIGDRRGEGGALALIGLAYTELKNFPRAIEPLEQSLAIARSINDPQLEKLVQENLLFAKSRSNPRKAEADRLLRQGREQFQTSQFEAALKSWQQVLIIYREIKDRQGERASLGRLGIAYGNLGDYPRAIEYLQQSLAIAREIQDRQGEGMALGNLGNAYYSLGDYPRAIEYQKQDLEIAREIQDRQGEGMALGNLGNAYRFLGDYPRAIEYQKQWLAIAREIQDRQSEGMALGNLGVAYYSLGDYLRAIEYHKQRLAIAREIKDRQGEGASLGNLGVAYYSLGDYPRAIEYHKQRLAIAREIKERQGEGASLGNLGVAYYSLGDYPRAIEYHKQRLAIAREIKERQGEGASLGNLGIAYYYLGDYPRAIEYLKQTLAIARSIKDRQSEMKTLNNLGFALFKQGNLTAAETNLTKAIEVSESLRGGLKDPDKVSIFETQSSPYHTLQQVLIAQNKSDAALEIAERGRARAFVELLAQRLSLNPQETLPATSLKPTISVLKQIASSQNVTLVQYSIIYEEFKVQGKQQLKESEIYIWVIKPTGEVAFRRVDLKPLWLQQNTSLSELVPNSPSVVPTAPNSAIAVQTAPESGIERKEVKHPVAIALILLTTSSAIGIVLWYRRSLPIPKAIQNIQLKHSWLVPSLLLLLAASGGGGLFFFLTFNQTIAHNRNVTTDSLLAELVSSTRESMGTRGRGLGLVPVGNKTNYSTRFKQLHQILIEPIADLLPKDPNAKVIFIPQKSLFQVPFPALQDKNGKYLIEKHTILTAPSIQVLELTRKQQQRVAAIHKSPLQGKDALIVGNPTMPSVPPFPGEPPQQLPSLPGAEEEAKAIATLLKSQAITGNNATKKAILDKISTARIIHLATHGLLDEYRGLGSAIALTPFGNDKGLLTAEEILDLKLNAELVVLSACDTGRGKITGDGIIGLSRSLISAGVPSVIVSLWSVPDAPTASLMTEFYQNLQKNPDRAAALRQAMLTTMKQHPDPKDWAAFTLIGEAK